MAGGATLGRLALVAVIGAVALHATGLVSARGLDMVIAASLAISLFGPVAYFTGHTWAGALAALVALAGTLGVLFASDAVRYTPYLPIAITYVGLAVVFGRSLMPGRVPILEQLIRAMGLGPEATPAFRRFVRGQCVAWAALSATQAVVAGLAIGWAGARPMLDPAIWTLFVAQLLLFPLSHFYAAWRYQRPETWTRTLREMVRPATWSVLEI